MFHLASLMAQVVKNLPQGLESPACANCLLVTLLVTEGSSGLNSVRCLDTRHWQQSLSHLFSRSGAGGHRLLTRAMWELHLGAEWTRRGHGRCACVLGCSRVSKSYATPGTVACQAPQSRGFSRQEYWSRLPFPPPGDLPDPGIEPMSPASPPLAGGFFAIEPRGKPAICKRLCNNKRVTWEPGNKWCSLIPAGGCDWLVGLI